MANRQHGVVARWQLDGGGITRAMVKARLGRGSLTRLHRGVYAVGHGRLTPEGHALAAVLALGPGAALSHRDAAWLHELRPSNRRRIDVTTTRRGAASSERIDVHRTRVLAAADVTVVDGIPVTTVARTLVDLAGVVPRDHLARALNEADRRDVVDLCAIEAALERTRARTGPGHARLRSVLALHRERGIELLRSKTELAFMAVVERSALPRPRTNLFVDGEEVDACWPDERVAVELDGWETHKTRRAAERDRAKTNRLQLLGWTVLRYTHRQLLREQTAVVSEIRAALRRR